MIRGLCLGLLAALAACRSAGRQPTRMEEPPLQVGRENILIAETGRLQSGPTISGTLEAERQATLRAEVGGSVVEVRVEQGQPVTAGALLVRLDPSAIQDAYEAARTALQTAQESAELAQRNADRAAALSQAGAIAERDLETARWNATNAASQLAGARNSFAQAAKQLAKTEIRAPFSGQISERPVSDGDVVQAGDRLVTVVDPTNLKLEASVPADAVERLKVGTQADFTLSGVDGRSFNGQVYRINPAVDPATRQVRITVRVPNAGRALLVGLFAQGRLALESHQGIAVPNTAVDERGPVPLVYRIRSDRVEKVPVRLGVRDEVAERVEIVSGVSPGDTLMMGSAQGISEGARVRVIGD